MISTNQEYSLKGFLSVTELPKKTEWLWMESETDRYQLADLEIGEHGIVPSMSEHGTFK